MLEFIKFLFEGDCWYILLKISICLLTIFLVHQLWFYTAGKNTEYKNISLKEGYIEWKDYVNTFHYDSFLMGVFKFSIHNKTYFDILTCTAVFIPSLIVFYFSEWFINICLLFINFDESGLLNFVVKWMPDNCFFNIMRLVFNIIDGFETTVMLLFSCCFTFVFYNTFSRGFLFPIFFKVLCAIVIFALYNTDYNNWICDYFKLSEPLVRIMKLCYWGKNLDYVHITFPLSAFFSILCISSHKKYKYKWE